MGLLTLTLVTAITSCGAPATPQTSTNTTPRAIVTPDINQASGPQVIGVQTIFDKTNTQAATGTTGSPTGVKVDFDTPMDRASTERAISVYPGEINAASNPATWTALGLTSMCNGSWRVRNANSTPITFTWDVYNTSQKGIGVAPANSDVFFTSSLGANTVRVFVNGKQQQVKATNPAACTSNPYTFTWSADSKSVTVKPSSALTLGKTYSLAVSTLAKNSSGAQSLVSAYSSKFVVKADKETGTLTPGGEYRFANGIIVRAPMEALQTVAQVTLEQLPSSAVSEPIPGDFENVGPFYHLKVVASQSTRFSLEIGIPYPSELRGQNLFPAFLLPNNASSEGNSDEGYRWAVEPNFGMDQERVFTSTANGDEDGVIFALLKRKLASQSTTGQTVSSKEIKSVVICDPKGAPINCDEKNIEYAELPGLADKSYFEHIFTMGLESSERPIFKWAVNLVSKTFSDCTSGAQAYYQNGIIYFCVDDNSKKLVSKDHPAIMRHEMFHAVQAVWVKSFAKSIKWIIEATAELSEESPSTLSVSKDLFPRRIELGLTLNDYPNSIEYKTQDFWAYVGKKRSKKLNYLKPLLQSKLRNPLSDTDVNIGYSGGLRAAYWDFVKDQGYERTIDAHNVGSPCILAVNGKLPHLLNGTVVPEATLSMSGPEVNQPYSINSLSTRVIPIRFNNPIEQNVKITITSNSGPDLKYKVYQGTVPAASKPGCENDPEGTVLSNQKAELTKSVTDKTELVVFVANTDFQNPAIFTVTVTPINTTSISLANPYGPLTTDNRLILRGIPGKETTGQLIITNQGDIGSSMQFTTMPIGHQVVDGGVSIAGLRNPGVLDLGTANRQVWAANLFGQSTGVLRHPNDPDPANGVTSVIVPIKATCPANAWGAETSLDIVYSNGLIDDYDTPDDPSDDRPELESTTVYVYLECASKRISGHYFVSWRGDVYQWYLKTFTNVMAPGDYQVRCMPITPELKKEPIVNLNGYFDTKNRVVTETGQVWRPGIYDLEVTGEFIQPSQLLADTGETLTSPSVSGQTANKYQRRQSTYPSQSGQVQTNDSIGTSITIDEHGELWGSGRDDYGVASGSGKEYSGYKYLETKVKIPGPRDIVEVEWDGL